MLEIIYKVYIFIIYIYKKFFYKELEHCAGVKCTIIGVLPQGEAHEKKKRGRKRKIDKWLEGQPDAAAFKQSMALLATMQPGESTQLHVTSLTLLWTFKGILQSVRDSQHLVTSV